MNVRLIAMAVAVAMAFFSGWTVRGWRADAAASKVEVAASGEKLERAADTTQAIARADTKGREVVVRYVTRTRYVAAASAQVKEEIRDAERLADTADLPRSDLSGEWLRLYNAALAPGGGDGAPAGGTAGSPGGAGVAPAQAESGTVDQWDVLSNHAENAVRWQQCRVQLNALIDSVGDSQTGVVTR